MRTIEKLPKKKEELLGIWINKGLEIDNTPKAIDTIQRLNYYRLIGYAKYYYNEKKQFKDGTSFNDIYNLYLFDRELRNIISNVVEEIELNFKSYFASYMSNEYSDVYAHLKNEYFDSKVNKDISRTYYEELKEILEKKKEKNKNKPYIKHYINEYGEVPIWVIVEILSFNDMSKLIRNMKNTDRKQMLNQNYDRLPVNPYYLPNLIKIICDVRNMCAHYEKVFNLNLDNVPKLNNNGSKTNMNLYNVLELCKKLINDKEKWNNSIQAIDDIIKKYNFKMIDLMGITSDHWKDRLCK